MPRLIDELSCLGSFIQIFVGHSLGGHKYFITFIDDSFRYGFVEAHS